MQPPHRLCHHTHLHLTLGRWTRWTFYSASKILSSSFHCGFTSRFICGYRQGWILGFDKANRNAPGITSNVWLSTAAGSEMSFLLQKDNSQKMSYELINHSQSSPIRLVLIFVNPVSKPPPLPIHATYRTSHIERICNAYIVLKVEQELRVTCARTARGGATRDSRNSRSRYIHLIVYESNSHDSSLPRTWPFNATYQMLLQAGTLWLTWAGYSCRPTLPSIHPFCSPQQF